MLLSADPERSVSILISTANLGGATNADYTGVPSSLTFASGETRKTFTLTAADDTENDDGERVELGFEGLPTGVSPGDTPTATVSIADNDDPAVTVSFEARGYTVAEGRTVSVSVLLSADPERSLSIPLETTNLGGATGADYSGVPASLTFGSGETKTTFAFMAVADMVGDDGESVKLGFVNLPARVSEGAIHEATVSITDPTGLSAAFPRTQLLDWFNRATAVETVNALGDRFREAPRGPRAVLRGIALRPMGREAAASLVNRQDIYGWPEREARLSGFNSARELLSESSFYLPLQPDDVDSAGEPGNFVAWGKGSTLQVQNRHGNVSIDGSTATFRMGVDGEWDKILAGIAIGKTTGDARFDWAPCTDLCGGRMEADLTSLQAYARANPRPHLSVWAALAYGTGEATETFDRSELLGIDGFTMKADLEQIMAALGAYGALLPAETAYGFEVGLQTDALFARMGADYAGDEYDADAKASRVRLALVAERDHQFDWGGVIAGAMEAGLRLDGGDGVTGAGLEMAGRAHHFNPILGLTASASLGGVLMHTGRRFRGVGGLGLVPLGSGPFRPRRCRFHPACMGRVGGWEQPVAIARCFLFLTRG